MWTAAKNNLTVNIKENATEQNIIMDPNNTKDDNINNQFYEIGLKTDVFFWKFGFLTIYNWRSINVIASLNFLITSYM